MNVYIVGAGAIGTWFGDQLRSVGCSIHYAPRALAQVQPIDAELAVVAVKAFDTPGAIATLKRALGETPTATILCLQNGVGNEELLAEAFGANAVVAGAITVPVEKTASGAIGANRGGIGIAPWGTQAHNWLIATLGGLRIPVVVAPDAKALKWSKLALNCVANASCAILDLTPAEVVGHPGLFALECAALRETQQLFTAMPLQSLDLPRYPVRALLRAAGLPLPLARFALAKRIARARGNKAPSLLLDIQHGKTQSEVHVLNGAVARYAERYNIAAPVHTALTRILSEIAEQPTLWERYRKRPDALLAEISRPR